jgi:hypothetical protein
MTPRTAPGSVTVGPESLPALDHVEELWDEARGLLHLVQEAKVESPQTRIARARACLDRVDGIRDQLQQAMAKIRDEFERERFNLNVAMAEAGGGHQQYSTGEERQARRLLANVSQARRVSQFERTYQFIHEAYLAVRDIGRSIDSHRIEALSLMRAGVTIAAEEYLVDAAS